MLREYEYTSRHGGRVTAMLNERDAKRLNAKPVGGEPSRSQSPVRRGRPKGSKNKAAIAPENKATEPTESTEQEEE